MRRVTTKRCVLCVLVVTVVVFLGKSMRKKNSILQKHLQQMTYLGYVSKQHEKETAELHIVTNYAVMTESPWNYNQTAANMGQLEERQVELEETLQRNLDHSLVKNVHLLINQEFAQKRLLDMPLRNKHKIIFKRTYTMPKYRDFFSYIDENLRNSLVILTNMDIYLDEGFEKINKTFLVQKNVCYALTRLGQNEKRCNMSGKQGYCGNGYWGSHDTYIFLFTKPLTEPVLSEFDFPMHLYGVDNLILWILKHKLRMKLLNPCEHLKTYHMHCIDIHGDIRPRVNTNSRSETKPESGMYN